MARNYARDRLTQALMANMTRAPNDPVPQREMPPPIFDPAPQREVPMINDPAPAPFTAPPAMPSPMPSGGGGGRGAPAPSPTSAVGYGYGWNGLPPPVAVNDPAPGFVPGAGNAPGNSPAYDAFGGQPHGLAAIEASGGSRASPTPPAQFASAQSFGVPPGGTEPFFPPNDVYSAPAINPAVFGGQPYGLAAIQASGGYPSGQPTAPPRDPAPIPDTGSFDWSVYGGRPRPVSSPGTTPSSGLAPPSGPGVAPTPPAQFAGAASYGLGPLPDTGSFDWGVYGGRNPVTGAGRRLPEDDGLGPMGGPDFGPGPDPTGGHDPTGGTPTGGPDDRGEPGDRGDPGDKGNTPSGVPGLGEPIEITDHPVAAGPNDNPPIGIGGPQTEVPPGFGLDPKDFEDRFGFGPPGMDPVAPFDYGVPGFGPGQTPAVGPDNPYQSYGSAEPPGGVDPFGGVDYGVDLSSVGWDFDPEFDAYDEEPGDYGDEGDYGDDEGDDDE